MTAARCLLAGVVLLASAARQIRAADEAPAWASISIVPGKAIKPPIRLLTQKGDLAGCRATIDPAEGQSLLVTADVPPKSIDYAMGTKNVSFAVEIPVTCDAAFASMIDIDLQGNGSYGTVNIDTIDADGKVRATGVFSLSDRRWRNYRTSIAAAVRNDAGFDASRVRAIRVLFDTFSHPANASPFRVRRIRFSADDQLQSINRVFNWLTDQSKKDAALASDIAAARRQLATSATAAALADARSAIRSLQTKVFAASNAANAPCVVASAGPLELQDEAIETLHAPLVESVNLDSAANEFESRQLLVIPVRGGLSNVRLTLGDLKDTKTGQIIPAANLSVRQVADVYQHPGTMTPYERVGPIADVLLSPTPAAIDAEKIGRYWLTVFTPAGTPKGEYLGQVTIESDGHPPVRLPLTVQVRGFALPNERAMTRQFNYWGLTTALYYGYPREMPAGWQPHTRTLFAQHDLPFDLLKQHIQWLADYRLDVANVTTLLPVVKADGTSDFTKLDELIDICRKAGQRCFVLSESDADQPAFEKPLKTLIDHMKQRGLFEQSWIYVKDEPADAAAWADVANRVKTIRQRFGPDIKTMLADATALDPRSKQLDTTLMRPFWAEIEKAKVRVGRQQGQQIGQYLCLYPPGQPHLNYFVTGDFIEPRVWEWLNWQQGTTDTLYWAVNYWMDNKPGTSPLSKDWVSNAVGKFNGDGHLVYPGKDGELLASVRLESIRDGIEDFEYLALLKREADRLRSVPAEKAFVATADALLNVRDVVRSPVDWSPDPAVLLATRTKIADLIEQAMVKNKQNPEPR